MSHEAGTLMEDLSRQFISLLWWGYRFIGINCLQDMARATERLSVHDKLNIGSGIQSPLEELPGRAIVASLCRVMI